MEPHPDRDDEPEVGSGNRGAVITAVVVGAIFLIVIALHLAGVMGPSSHG